MHPNYIADNLDELYGSAPAEIQGLIDGGEVNTTTAILGKAYTLQVSKYSALSDLIIFLLIGALKPQDAVQGIIDMLGLSEDEALKLAADLDKTILEKARIQILGKAPTEMVTLEFKGEGRSQEELRKELLDTTKRGPFVSEPTPPASPEATAPQPATQPTQPNLIPGSRSALMDQLKILDTIPNDEEVTERLKKIQEQIASSKQNEGELDSGVVLPQITEENINPVPVDAVSRSATYAKAPTHYNVDPYREVVEE